MGGTTDIDLVFVHKGKIPFRREVIFLSPEIHLDIKHNPISEYDKPRDLRMNPWLGPELWDPMLLFEKEHFFEFIQAVVRDKFFETVNVIARARKNLDHARQIWRGLQLPQVKGPALILSYLKSLNHAANAVAIMNGPVLAERRYLLQLPACCEAVGKPAFFDQLIALLGSSQASSKSMTTALPHWSESFIAAGDRTKADARLHPARLNYYKCAMEAMLESGNPHALLWPLLCTWTLAVSVLPKARCAAWEAAIKDLGLSGNLFKEHLENLDHLLDGIEMLLDDTASAQGLGATYQDGRKVD